MTKRIRIVGLGPGPADQLTVGAWRAVTTAAVLVLRTDRHPYVGELTAQLAPSTVVERCDDLYEQHAAFEQVYAAIVERVIALAQTHDRIVYAVPGHPCVGEMTTPLLQDRAAATGIDVEIVAGVSFIEPGFAAVGVDPMDGAQVIDAMIVAQRGALLRDRLPALHI